jgi:hypothetical protein
MPRPTIVLFCLLVITLLIYEPGAASSIFASAKALKSKVDDKTNAALRPVRGKPPSQPLQPIAQQAPLAAEIHHHVQRHEQKIHNYSKGLAKMGGKIGKGIAFAALSLSLASVVSTIIQHKPSGSDVQPGAQIDFLIYALVVYFVSMLLMAFLI